MLLHLHLDDQFRIFRRDVCSLYDTRELPTEEAARGRRLLKRPKHVTAKLVCGVLKYCKHWRAKTEAAQSLDL